jgi:hypothetical protein
MLRCRESQFRIVQLSNILNPMFGLHSPRIGATADAFKEKVPEHVIDKRGRWKSSNSKFGYLRKKEDYFIDCLKK